uniref:C2H2-type domain-containing protein n=1 Tax=Panagrolaimus davidi TaxID=227884 RepID=A0A914PPQ8_9BILA
MDLLNHFRYECEQSGTISAATVSNGLPSLLTNNETSEANAISTVAATGTSSKYTPFKTKIFSIGPSPRYSSPKIASNNHHEKFQQQHFLHSQKPFIQKFENANSIPPKTDMSGRFQPPILLPITVHSDDPYSIRVIGPPQFIIPIAVGRKTDLLVSSLHVDPLLSGSITIPSTLPISNGIPNFSIPIHSTLPQQILPPSNSASSIPSGHHHHPLPIKRQRISTDSRPLDLSLKVPKSKQVLSSSSSSQLQQPSSSLQIPANFLSLASTLNSQLNSNSTPSKLSAAAVAAATVGTSTDQNQQQRRYKCGCGVEFTSETVYIGHKNYYCRLRPQSEEENSQRQQVQKFPEQCLHCDFRPSSSSNLSQHIREQHAAIKAYICSKCGYRGFSARGIRAHLTSHHRIDDYEKYILEDRGNTKIYSCPQCHHVFLAQEQLSAHQCSKKS